MPCRCSSVLPAFAGLLAVFCWPSLAGASAADLGRETGAGPPSRGGGVPRASMDLSHGWRFRQEAGLAGVERSEFDDSQWTGVDLPHTWNRIGNEGAERSPLTNTVQGVGWYRLRFAAPPSSTARRYFLQFDGVGAIADVWLNGRYLGRHAGAFSRFRFDASAAIKPSGDNLLVSGLTIAVRNQAPARKMSSRSPAISSCSAASIAA